MIDQLNKKCQLDLQVRPSNNNKPNTNLSHCKYKNNHPSLLNIQQPNKLSLTYSFNPNLSITLPCMFSSFTQPQNNLFTSQRFYYNNYQYYNDYQKIQTKYSDDLSKVYFRLNRKTKGTIFYEWNHTIKPVDQTQSVGSSGMDIQNQSKRSSQNEHDPNRHKEEFATKQLGIQNLLSTVLATFHQQNYSDIRLDQQPRKQLYEFVHLKYLPELNHIFNPIIQDQSVTPYEPNSIDVLNDIIKKESQDKQLYYEALEKMNSFAKQEDQMFLERWNAFENFGFYYLDHLLLKKDNARSYKEELKRLYKFVIKVRFILQRTLAATYFNSLLISLPNLKKTSRVFHPLTMGLTYTNKFFQQKNGFKNKPNIVFLNLDGRQTPYNLRYARNVGSNLLYISVFKQPSHSYKKGQKMEHEFESEYDTTFGNICENYSRLLINEAYPVRELFASDENKYRDKSRMLMFPLGSEYLRKECYKASREKSANTNTNNNTTTFPKLQTSHDIYFLFQTIIFQQIRSFDPSFIFVSYNGFLNLSQQHWNQIIKNLTIIADHKICLFVDFVDKLGRARGGEDQQDQQDEEQQQANQGEEQQNAEEQQQQEQDDLDQFKVRNIQVVRQYINKYIPFKHFWPHIDHQRVINHLLLFLKLSSGVYSTQPKLLLAHHLKYSLGHRYAFLQSLCQSKELSQQMQKYVPKLLKSEQIRDLYGNQSKIELKENRKENQVYQKLIDLVIVQFLNQQSRQSRAQLNPKLYYRLQQVLQQQQQQNLLRYGTQQDHSPQYSSTFSNSNPLQNRQSLIIHDYLKEMKRKLLLENLQTYKHKKVFYHQQDADSPHQSLSTAQKIKCYKFYLYEDDAEEIAFDKYTQIIFDPKRSRVYIVNYKANDDRHLILYGNMTPTTYQKKCSVKVQIAKQSQSDHHPPLYSLFPQPNPPQTLQSTTQQQSLFPPRKDLVFVNYSHCFVKNKLYLYWPQKWSIRDQIRHKLLNLRYKPQNVNVMLRVQYNSDNQCVYETLQLNEHQKIYVHPRIKCSSYQIHSQTSDDQFFIFGGILDNENDFFDIGEGIYSAHVKDGGNSFFVKPLPKIKDKNSKQSTLNLVNMATKKNPSFALRLRPKMHYRIQRYIPQTNSNSPQEVKLIISGGYGRQYTNFFNFFSFDSYLFNVNTKFIEAKEIHQRRLIKLPKPIQVNRVGKFYMISNNQNIQEVEENFSDLPKDFFAFEYKTQKALPPGMSNQQGRENRQSMMNLESGGTFANVQNSIAKHCQNREVHSFIDERYRTSEFKFDGKKIYLCGFNRTIRQKIYSKFWSPQLYILDGNQSSIVHISLKTQKSFNYNISNFLMPRQQDIISLCLDEDKLYVLSSSPVIHSIDYSNIRYVLYEGNLSSMSDVINKHELQMHERFDFKKQKDNMLKYKTLYAFDQKIYLFGGLTVSQDPSIMTLTNEQSMDIQSRGKVSYREDYILEKEKSKFVLKTRKVESSKDSVEMLSPAIVKFNQLLYFYSIEMTQTVVKIPNTPFNESKENYKLKIQQFNSQSSAEGRCISQIMKFYAWDGPKQKIQRIVPRLKQPKFVSISKHQPFNLSKFREHLEKAAIRLRKYIDEKFTTDKKVQEKPTADKKTQEDPSAQIKLQNLLSNCLVLLKEKNSQLVIATLQTQDKFFKDLINSIRPQVNERERNIEQEELIKDLKICYSLVNKLILQTLVQRAQMQESNRQQTSSNHESMSNENIKREKLVEKLQKLTLNSEETKAEYRFIVEDSKSSRKIRYIAIGPLVNVEELRFFRIRFRHDVSLCLNKTNQDGFYYHPTVNSCQEIDLNDQFTQYDIMSEEDIKNDSKSYKEYRLYCQLKV